MTLTSEIRSSHKSGATAGTLQAGCRRELLLLGVMCSAVLGCALKRHAVLRCRRADGGGGCRAGGSHVPGGR